MSEIEKLIEIYKQLEDAGLMVVAGKKDTAELMVSHDVVPVVRCKDCKHSEKWKETLCCPYYDDCRVEENHFCSYGERRTDGR